MNLYRLIAIAVVALALVPRASAGIIGIANATKHCSSNGLTNGGGTICSGNTAPYSLTALLNGTEVLHAVVGTQTAPVYLVNNDTGSTSFTLVFSGWLQSNQSVNCQENGGFAGERCTVSGALGKVGNGVHYGPPSPNGQLVASVTFTGVPAGEFDLTFASFGNGDSGTLTGPSTSGSGGCADASNPVVVPSAVIISQLISAPLPVYSPSPKDGGTYGTVVLNVVIGCTGKVISSTVLSGPDWLASAVQAAVDDWTFQPYLVNGIAVAVQTTITVSYDAGPKAEEMWDWW